MSEPQSTDDGLLLAGLDGANPLAFLAALGTLRTLSTSWPQRNVRMSWTDEQGAWRPRLHATEGVSSESIVEGIVGANREVKRWIAEADGLDYAGFGDVIAAEPPAFADFLAQARDMAGRASPLAVEALGFAAAYASDACRDKRGRVEPTPFSFGNGQSGQCLLRSFRQLRGALTAQNVREALFGPWRYQDERPTLRWDPRDCRRYALMATDPGQSKTTPIRTVRGANYLAFLALPLLPCVPTSKGPTATGMGHPAGTWAWTWPIWKHPANTDIVRSLLALRELQEPAPARAAFVRRGIPQVYRARRFSLQKGLYFSPARGL